MYNLLNMSDFGKKRPQYPVLSGLHLIILLTLYASPKPKTIFEKAHIIKVLMPPASAKSRRLLVWVCPLVRNAF